MHISVAIVGERSIC